MKALLFLLTLALSQLASAALIYEDNYVIDTTTGSQWLKLSLSKGLSADNIYTQNGWEIAHQFGDPAVDPLEMLSGVISELGYNGFTELGAFLIDAPFDISQDLMAVVGTVVHPFAVSFEWAGWLGPEGPLTWTLGGYTEQEVLGASWWLVKTDPLPLPTTAWLFASALLGLLGLKRRH